MKSRMKRTWFDRMLEAGGCNRRSDSRRKFGFEVLEGRCLLSVSAGVAAEAMVDTETVDLFVEADSDEAISPEELHSYRNDPLADVLSPPLVRLFREFETWPGPGDYVPYTNPYTDLVWTIEGNAVEVVIYGTRPTLHGVQEAAREQLGVEIRLHATLPSAGVAMVPIDLLDNLAQIDHISRVDATRPAMTRDVAPAEAANKTVSVTVSDELVGLFAGPLRGKIGSDLYLLQKEYEAHKADPEAGPFDPNRPGLVTVGDEVVVTVVFGSLLSQEVDLAASARMHAQELEKLGFTVQHAFGPSVTGSVRPDLLDDVASLEGVLSMRATYRSTRTGSITSQGDQTQRSDVARSTYSVVGSGVQVGMISDSMASATGGVTYSDDVASGDLPPVTILADATGTDEGRAMAQIVHDVAPAAELLFHTVGEDVFGFSNAILELMRSGADVIVDDTFFNDEPYFMRGPISRTIDYITNDEVGVTYVTAVGNDADNSYESSFTSSGVTILHGGEVLGLGHDFDPGPDVDYTQQVTVPPSGILNLGLQWDQPYATMMGGFAAPAGPYIPNDHDYDLYLFDSGGNLVANSDFDNIGGDPVELLTYHNTTQTAQTYNLVLTRSPGSATGDALLKYIDFGGVAAFEYETNSSTVFGHVNADGAIAVGAAPYYTSPPVVEPFSSLGGNPIRLSDLGSPLSTTWQTYKPDIVASDGVNTAFFGQDIAQDVDSYPNFFGTSASAPHIAGAVALMLEHAPSLGAFEIESILEDTAEDMHTGGFDFLTGNGFADVLDAMGDIGTRFPHFDATDDPAPGNQFGDGTVDSFVVARSGSSIEITINGSGLPSIPISSVDAISLGGSSDVDLVTVYDLGNDFNGRIVINSNDTAAALDNVYLHDTSGDDQFEGAWRRSALTTSSYSVIVRDAYGILPYASAGYDTANLHGLVDAGTDRFKGEHDLAQNVARLFRDGVYHFRTKGFEEVNAFGEGGTDTAVFYDDAASTDTFTADMHVASHTGVGFNMSVARFPVVTAYGNNSNGDVATLFNSDIKDEFVGKSHKSELFDRTTGGTVYSITARGFSQVRADASRGATRLDIAKLYDTASTDLLRAFLDDDVPHISLYADTGSLDLLYEAIAWETVSARSYDDIAVDDTTDITGTIDSLILSGSWDGVWY